VTDTISAPEIGSPGLAGTTVPPEEYVARARRIAPIIEAEADAMEDGRTISAPVVQALKDNDLFWLLVPREYGGAGIGIVPALKVIEELARADGSTGWAVMANAFSMGIAAGFMGADGAREIFGGAVRGITAGMILPTGKGVRVEGGYRVDGRYGFASGSAHADWIGAGFVIHDDDGNPLSDEAGQPLSRVAFVPRDQVTFLGGWDVMGMVATGSDDYAVKGVFVPEPRTMDTFSTVPVRSEPVYKLGLLGIGVGGHGPVVLGIAQRALEEVATLTSSRGRPGYPTVVADAQMFRREFVTHEASLQAARHFVYAAHAEAEATAAEGREITDEQRARLRQVTTWVQGIARDIVTFAFSWGGSGAFRNPSALGRCLRDISTGANHVLVEPMTLVDAADQILPTYVRSK
jgi:alkylation response protein AidB-like acyl-CoA dehydrogenase